MEKGIELASLSLFGFVLVAWPMYLAQLMAFAVTGTIGWFLLDLRHTPRLITFWLCWSVARTAFLLAVYNPIQDILIYLLWIAFWCALYGLLARVAGKGRELASGSAN